ncbi:MAG TPA: outer membrane beta-barrel protein [Steroidobacter sp.]
MMKQLATGMTLALMCLPAIAEPMVGFYSGAAAGQVSLKDNIYGVSIKETGTGFSIFAGYRFNEYGTLEIAYLDGTGDDTVSGVRIETDANAIQGSALVQIPISVRFEGFVRVGFIMWDAEHSATNGQIFVTQENDGTDAMLGIGAAFHVTPKFGLRAEYAGAELDGTDLRSLSLAGLYRF